MPLDTTTLAGVYRMLPNQQTLTLTPQNPTAGAITVAGCVRRPWSQKEVQGLGSPLAFNSEVSVFLLPKAELAGNVPIEGWKITDTDSVAWTIKAVSRELEGTIFRCPVIRNVS